FKSPMWITPLPPSLSALGEGSHGSILNGNYAPNRLSSAWKPTIDVPGNATEFKTLLMKAVPPTARIFVAALGEWESKNIPRADEWLEARKDGERQVLLPQAGDPH
ncbi:hypothetical protein, partial [Neorhizobium galegae]|uniref:hypothetical protein n=1 Tax=Neorhizobium galegae TaxID=399 RepID=UPI0021066AE8